MNITARFNRIERRGALVIGVSVAASLLLMGCSALGTDPSSTHGGDDKFTIGIAQASTEIPFLAALDEAITKKANELGMKTVILNGRLDNAIQAANVKTLVSKKVDAIIVVSSNPTAPLDAIAEADAARIPVFAVCGALDEGAKIVTYIGDSDFEYGKAQGQLLIKALPDGGKVAVILGPLGDAAQVQRLAGLQEAIKDHPDIQIVDKPVDNFDNAQNLAATQDLVSKYPKGSLNAVVAQGPEMYVGANYARERGRDEIRFIAGDYPMQIEDAIRSGVIYGTVDQSPSVEGERGAQSVYYWLTGQKDKVKTPKDLIDLPVVTKESVDRFQSGWSF
jgi:ribose transport system substrate-binding protein